MDERRRVSRRQEAAGAKRFSATQHSGSGSGWLQRNDQHTASLLIEYKTVVGGKKQITIKADDLTLVERTAAVQGRLPVLQFELPGKRGNKRFVILAEDDFLEQQERASGNGDPPPPD